MTTRRVTVDLPSDPPQATRKASGTEIAETTIEGLEQSPRHRFYERALALRGKLKLKVDSDECRGRRHR